MTFPKWIAYISKLKPEPEPPLSLSNSRKITKDGRNKVSFPVTDGSRLYFLEVIDGNRVPFQVATTGGEIAEIPVPFPSIALLDISPDQTELLIGSLLTVETEMQLWVMPVLGGSPRSIGNLRGHAAAWSSDGKYIVYANGSKLYLADNDGAQSHELVDVRSGLPYNLCWSPDGSLLRFDVQDLRTRSTSLWEVNADGTNLRPLLPEWNKPAAERCGNWTPDGKYFLFQSTRDKRTSIWAIREKSAASSETGHDPIQLIEGAPSYKSPVVSKDGKTLFVVGEMNRGELVRYDTRTKQWVSYLGGISADQVKFSSDGQWILYVTYPEGELWKSKVDGSDRQQLSFSPLRVHNAQWSPDDKRISFTAMEPGENWKGYLISAEGGNREPLTSGSDNERVAGWSPDGNSLILLKGERVLGQTAINLFDLKTKSVSELPDSKALFGLGWSPKGDYISAIRSKDGKGLMLYDVKSQVWKELINMNVANLSWSRDGKYIYFRSFYQNDPSIFRVRIPDGKTERWATLKGLQQASGAFGPWMGLAPDDSILMLRDIGIQNIYAFDLQSP
jgi:Tol biopolymer transport system component